jgi:hypothetical protein
MKFTFSCQEAEVAKRQNIIEMALDFASMTRVLEKESSTKILSVLEQFFTDVAAVATAAEYDSLHADFCNWFVTNIRSAEKKFPNGQVAASCRVHMAKRRRFLTLQ